MLLSLTGLFLFFYIFAIPHGVTSELKDLKCDGKIISIEKDTPCFSKIAVQQMNDIVHLTVCYCVPEDQARFFDFAAAGDRIVKKEGQLSLTVIKGKDNKVESFEYPFCLH